MSQISFVSVLALDEMVSVGADRGEQVSLIDTLADRGIDPTQGVESQETRGLLAAAINELSEREKIVVTLYYFEGLTLAEIGEILGRHRIACVPDPHEGRRRTPRPAHRGRVGRTAPGSPRVTVVTAGAESSL